VQFGSKYFSQYAARLPHGATPFRLHLREPEAHVHLAVHVFRSGEVLVGATWIARATMNASQAEKAMSGERPHAARFGEHQRCPVVSGGTFGVEVIRMNC
jgi:hypothetical protein